jgi:hypothetical protein
MQQCPRTLSMNCGSVDSFHVSTRCGLSPNARQIREIADCDIPVAVAIDRVDQCVPLLGGFCGVKDLLAAEQRLPELIDALHHTAIKAAIHRYVAGIHHCIAGSNQWHAHRTHRYTKARSR